MTSAVVTAPPSRARRRLGRRARKTVLLAHIASAGIWLGLDVTFGILVVTSVVTDDPSTRGVAYRALGLLTVWPMTVTGLICLVSGVLLGLGTKYGLVRYWWVALKLVLNLALATLILVALPQNVGHAVERGRLLLEGVAVPGGIGDLAFPPIVSTTALVVATVVSVFKPWGRIGGR